MENFVSLFMQFPHFFSENWDRILVVVILLNNFLKGLRDAIDTTPDTDDNAFERFVTIVGKVLGYLTTGKRST